MNLIGQEVTISLYDSEGEGTMPSDFITPERLLWSHSFTVESSSVGFPATANGAGIYINTSFTAYGSEWFGPNMEFYYRNGFLLIGGIGETHTSFLPSLLLLISASSSNLSNAVLSWQGRYEDGPVSYPAGLPDVFAFEDSCVIDVSNFIPPDGGVLVALGIEFPASGFWTDFIRSAES